MYSIKQIRSKLGLSQEAFAQKLGVTAQAVRSWEYGTSNPGKKNQVKLKAIIKEIEEISIEYFSCQVCCGDLEYTKIYAETSKANCAHGNLQGASEFNGLIAEVFIEMQCIDCGVKKSIVFGKNNGLGVNPTTRLNANGLFMQVFDV